MDLSADSLTHPDYPPVRAQTEDVAIDPREQPAVDQHLQSFRPDARGWDLPMVWIRTTQDPAFGVGDLAPPEVTTTVNVNGSIGYLVEGPSSSHSLGWRRTDGTAALIVAPGLDRASLVRFGRALRPRADGRGWEVDQLPPELVTVVDAPVSEITVLWSEREGTVAHELRLGDRAVDDLDELLVSIVEQDEAVWEQLIDRLGAR